MNDITTRNEVDQMLGVSDIAELTNSSRKAVSNRLERFNLPHEEKVDLMGRKQKVYSLSAYKKMCSDDDDEAHRLKADASAVRKHNKMTDSEKARSFDLTLKKIEDDEDVEFAQGAVFLALQSFCNIIGKQKSRYKDRLSVVEEKLITTVIGLYRAHAQSWPIY